MLFSSRHLRAVPRLARRFARQQSCPMCQVTGTQNHKPEQTPDGGKNEQGRRLSGGQSQELPKKDVGKKRNRLLGQLVAKIKMTGPMTVADYMKEALTHPAEGYYMKGDVFGVRGDFTTSPEISPMFGEMLGIWFLNEWLKLGEPKPIRIVELGPGRGTLLSDILRVVCRYQAFSDNLNIHLVEVSPGLKALQKRILCSAFDGRPLATKYRLPVKWHERVSEVPRGRFTLWVAHEFFDALPVHLLRKKDSIWHEILVDLDESQKDKLRFVMSRHSTPAAKAFVEPDESREYVEVSPHGAVIIQEIGKRIHEDGGMCLVTDYGHDGESKDSFRAFRKHEVADPLDSPGLCDLTADVDFKFLKKWASSGNEVLCYGPIAQGEFLRNLGIEIRLKRLLENCKDPDKRKSLITGYDMITGNEQMGSKFKFISVFPGTVAEIHEHFPPSGFFPLPKE